jgi:hypothetical protein
MSTEFLQGLIRRLYGEDAVQAAYLGGDLVSGAAVERIDLFLAAAPAFRTGLAAWLAPLGEQPYSGSEPDGWRVVTPDGVEWRFHFAVPADTAGLQPLFDRRKAVGTTAGEAVGTTAEESVEPPAGGAAEPPAEEGVDLTAMAGRFWADLYRAARALAKGAVFTAHGDLERCRRALVDLYRLALAPRQAGRGWEELDGIAGVEPLKEWLVAPLEVRAQWRSAHRLAAAYESLMLPLCQRLGLAYPMAMRNLAFQRLDQARPDRGAEGAAPAEAAPPAPAPAAPAGKMRIARGQIRRS